MKKRIRGTFLPVLGLGLWLGLGAAAWAEETDAVEDLQGPKLRELTIEGTPVRQFRTEAGEATLYRNLEGADVRISFCIEDERENWNAEAVKVTVLDAQGERIVREGCLGDSEIVWEETAASYLHRGSLEFDGEPGVEGVYQAVLSYIGENGVGLEETGSVESEPFILDHQGPKLQVTYTEPVRTLAADGTDLAAGDAPTKDCTAYYNRDVEVSFVIEETYAVPILTGGRLTGLADLDIRLDGKTADLQWEQTGLHRYTGTCRVLAEQVYRFHAACRDAAGNPMRAGNALVQAGMQEDEYEGHRLLIDRTAPKVAVSVAGKPVAIHKGRSYYAEDTLLQITVADENLRLREVRAEILRMQAEDSSGMAIAGTAAWNTAEQWKERELISGSRTLELPLTTEANYGIPMNITDLAGNQAVWAEGEEYRGAIGDYRVKVTIDKTAPDELKLTGEPASYLPYEPCGWLFSAQTVSLCAKARDSVAGIQKIRYTLTDVEGADTVREQSFEPAATESFELTLPVSQEAADFRGTVQAEVWDWTGRKSEKTLSCGVESAETHEKSAEARLAICTKPGRIVDGQAYYNTDVELDAFLTDRFTGLRDWIIRADGQIRSEKKYLSELTYEATETMKLRAADYNHNDVKVQAELTDNAGYESRAEISCNIDVTKPEITVTYDLNTPIRETCYREPRTATITIKERNFDPRDVEFRITNGDGPVPAPGPWTHSGSGDEMTHTCQLVFEADGAYTFHVSFQDLAGNRADYDRTDAFVIDRTPPELTVAWDNTDVQNGFYYKEARTARLTIREKNFDEKAIQIRTQVEEEGEEPELSAWSHNGELHTARLHFQKDGAYAFCVTGRDLADNELPLWESERFVLDQTPPELTIFDILDHSANNGAVRPGIRSMDRYYDPEGESITLTGYHNGDMKLVGKLSRSENGMEYKLDDIPMEQKWDDMYILKAVAADLAGNRKEETVTFSVNRCGSVYTLGEATERLAGEQGSYYTREEPELVILETNVDALTLREITSSHDGELKSLKEGTDYQVSRSMETGWQQYTYRIAKENFTGEGVYAVTLYSEDRASNVSDNRSKGKRLEFAVDKTPPVILVSGVEEKGRYQERHRTVLLDVQDNLGMRELQVGQAGSVRVYTAEELRENDGRMELTLNSADDWQELTVQAVDLAGNQAEITPIRFLLTPDSRIQAEQSKKPQMAGRTGDSGLTILLFGGMIATVLIGIRRRRKKIRIRENNS